MSTNMPDDLQYSYSSKPRAVLSNRAKAMRDPALLLPTNNEPRQLGPNIMYDPRIVRGSVFAPNQAPTPTRRSSDKKSSKRSGASGPRKKSQNIYEAQQVASYSFTPFSLDANLIEQPPLKHDRDGATQTDAFKEITVRTPKRAMADGVYQRPKVGIDSGTQIEVSDKLFNFDVEVKPLVNVLVSKTIAQALAEVKEEEEMKAIKRERVLLDEEKETQRKADRALEQKAREAVQKKAKTMQFQAQKLEERKRFNEKLLAWQLAHKMFPRVLSTAQATLYKKGVFYDPTQRELQQWLLTDVYVSADTKLRLRELSHRLLDGLLSDAMQRQAIYAHLLPHEHEALVRLLLKEPILVSRSRPPPPDPSVDESGEPSEASENELAIADSAPEAQEVTVIGPIALSRYDSLSVIEAKIHAWLRENVSPDVIAPLGGFLSLLSLSDSI